MEVVFVDQTLSSFQTFIDLCQLENWPNDDTPYEQIESGFLFSQRIEHYTVKLKRRNLYDQFISALKKKQKISSTLLTHILCDPPKRILKKIITSSANISKVDAGFTIFLNLFSEEKLEVYLSDLMLEAASKDTLLQKMTTELPKTTVSDFKSYFFLCKLNYVQDSDQVMKDLLNNYTQDVIDMLIVCLLNKNEKYNYAVKAIAKGFVSVMSSQNIVYKNFWKQLFHTEDDKFLQMCLIHNDIFVLISKALIDCAKLFQKTMSMEYFYIDLTYSELSGIIKKICRDGMLKLTLLDLLYKSKVDLSFWEREMKEYVGNHAS